MKRRQKRMAATEKRANARSGPGKPSVFEQLDAIGYELGEQVGLAPDPKIPKPKVQVPVWCRIIGNRFCRTIWKPILKLRFNGKVNWRNYGRMIGIVERSKTFWTTDFSRIINEEFGDLTKREAKKIEAQISREEIRARCVKALGRKVGKDESLEKLVDELLERRLEEHDRLREIAFRHVARQPAKISIQFFEGVAEGYRCFLDAEAKFSGDRGRTETYMSLLPYMLEVEQMRKLQPPITRAKFYDTLSEIFRLPPKVYDRFNDICDDIKFPLNNLGRPRNRAMAAG